MIYDYPDLLQSNTTRLGKILVCRIIANHSLIYRSGLSLIVLTIVALFLYYFKKNFQVIFFNGIFSHYLYNWHRKILDSSLSLRMTNQEEIHHTPVMLQEVLNSLPANPKIVVDGTLGHGGHTRHMLRLFPTIQKLYGFDLDPNIFRETKEKLEPEFGDRIVFENKSYTEIQSVLGNEKADFILVDLGVNLEHFKDGSRGFSTNIDGKLDMRFDNTNGKSAYDIVNHYSVPELTKIFEDYAEFTPKKSEEIAKKIVETRKSKPIETTFELKFLLNELGLGQKACAVIFQAFRIETNKEIDNVKMLLGEIPNILSAGGRCGIITFHSLEDRVVKQGFKALAETGDFSLLYKKAVQPTYQEIEKNKPSRSAKYRVIERIV